MNKEIGSHQFYPLLSAEELSNRTKQLAFEIDSHFENLNDDQLPVLITVLKGAARFAADFISASSIDWQQEFVQLKSYDGLKTTGKVQLSYSSIEELAGRNVLIVEDIVDSGLSLSFLKDYLFGKGIKHLKTLSLLLKPDACEKGILPDYFGFKLENKFVVGYGLDFNQEGRSWNQLYELRKSSMINLVLFGPPGAGKGTQSAFLVEKYKLIHLSTGDLLRAEIAASTKLGLAAKDIMNRGELVSDDIVIGMIGSKLKQNPDAKGFIFDGFPRTSAQAEALDELLEEYDTSIQAMLSLEVPKEELVKRLLQRGESSGRADDQNEEVIENRINEYNKKTAILKDYYTAQEKCISINGLGSLENITKRLCEAINS